MKLIILSMLILFFSLSLLAQDEFFEPQSTIGGYGELHYNVNRTKNTHTLDFHRFVLFYGHEWTPKWSLIAEVELEHNFVKSGQGELELEQAAVDFHPGGLINFRAGVILAPVGILNQTHEPPTFLSVERPDYAKVIVPTTWFGNGVSLYGAADKLRYNLTMMEGLNGDNFTASSGIRGGRQKGYKADAHHWLGAARLDYEISSGASAGLSYTSNQANRSEGPAVKVDLFEVHASYDAHNVIAVFEFGQISYTNYEVEASSGYYFDLGYDVAPLLGLDGRIIPWFRWSDLNAASRTVMGGESELMYHNRKWLLGLAAKPIDQVIFKIEFGTVSNQFDESASKIFNFGAGYMF